MPTLKKEKVQGKIGYKLIFCYSYSTNSPLKIMSSFFVETSILENMDDLNGSSCILML